MQQNQTTKGCHDANKRNFAIFMRKDYGKIVFKNTDRDINYISESRIQMYQTPRCKQSRNMQEGSKLSQGQRKSPKEFQESPMAIFEEGQRCKDKGSKDTSISSNSTIWLGMEPAFQRQTCCPSMQINQFIIGRFNSSARGHVTTFHM